MIVLLRWVCPELRAIVTLEVSALDLVDAGQRAARVLRQLAVPSERTVPFFPDEPRVRGDTR